MNHRVSIVLALALSTVILGGCATSATHQAMTVHPQANAIAVNPKLKSAIHVDAVNGGEETMPLGRSQVDNAGFKKALEDSLANVGYLVPAGASAPYTLSAELKDLDQPWFGMTFDVKSSVVYKLSGNGSAKEYQINATGTAAVSDAAVAIIRLRMANERSILENIKLLLKELETF
jgi:hypothetical protein